MAAWMIDALRHRRAAPPLAAAGSARWSYLASYCLTEPGAGSDAAALATRARARRRRLRAERREAVHLRRRRPRPLRGDGANRRRRARAASRPSWSRRIRPASRFGANEKKMGWNAQPTRAGDLRGRARAGRQPARCGGRRLQDRHGRARRRADQYRRLLARRRAGRRWTRPLAYMSERKAFGKRARSTSRRCSSALADMATELEAPRSLLWRAAAALDAKAPEATQLCAMAKRFATDAGFEVANAALQLHGGYGYLPTTASRRSCATCASTRSSRARTRSCA